LAQSVIAEAKGWFRGCHNRIVTADGSAVNKNLAAVCLTSVGRGTGGLRRFGLVTWLAGDELA